MLSTHPESRRWGVRDSVAVHNIWESPFKKKFLLDSKLQPQFQTSQCFAAFTKEDNKTNASTGHCNCRLGLLKFIYVGKRGDRTHWSSYMFYINSCQEPKTRPSRPILVTRRTACAFKGESFDWQRFSQEPISGCSETVGVRSWNFS